MALTLNADAQWPLVRTVEFSLTDLDGTIQNAISIPGGGIITNAELVVTSADAGAITADVAVGLAVPVDMIVGATLNAAAAYPVTVALDGAPLVDPVYVTIEASGASTDIEGYLRVEYIEQNRSTANASR